jgi:hypothetical protein
MAENFIKKYPILYFVVALYDMFYISEVFMQGGGGERNTIN